MKINPCPNCGGRRIVCNKILIPRLGGCFYECNDCHWCGKTKVIRFMARISWNKQNPERVRSLRGK